MKFLQTTCLAVLMAVASISSHASASPWAEAGDRQLRSDIELLSRHGLIRGPVTAWPIPWKQISGRLSYHSEQNLSPAVRHALYRVLDKMPSEDDVGRLKYSLEGRATNRAKIGRDFGESARRDLDGRAAVSIDTRKLSGRLSVGYQGDGDSGDLAFDDSYLAAALGNWMVYGGYVDRWWGPAWSSSTILSTHARPIPSAGIMRIDPRPFDSKLLSWMGPWQLNVSLGKLGSQEQYYADPYFFAMRLTLNPVRNLEIGLNRTFIICGADQQCGFKNWTNALIGVGNLDNPMDGDRSKDSSNQIAGFDIRYGFNLTDRTFMSIYGQMSGEDEKNFLPFKFSGVGGVSFDGPFGDDGASWRLIAEYSDTVAFFSAGRNYNTMYNHFRYRSGYRYRGDVIGDRWDSDSKAIYLSGMFTDTQGWTYRIAYQNARVNIDDAGLNYVSMSKETINLFEAGLTVPSPLGDFGLNLWIQDDSPNTPGYKDGRKGIEVDWKASF